MAEVSSAELKQLPELRQNIAAMKLNLAEWESTDKRLATWLRAGGHKVATAIGLLKASVDLKRSVDFANILQWTPPAHFSQDLQYIIPGNDNSGRPILIVPLANFDIRKVVDGNEQAAYRKHLDQMYAKLLQRMSASSERLNTEVTQCVLIIDANDVSVKKCMSSSEAVALLMELVQNFDKLYPESFHKIWLINCGRMLYMAVSVAFVVLSADTRAKITPLSSPDQWKPKLLEEIAPDQLPKTYGGTQ